VTELISELEMAAEQVAAVHHPTAALPPPYCRPTATLPPAYRLVSLAAFAPATYTVGQLFLLALSTYLSPY
jgi:hypothetical protein